MSNCCCCCPSAPVTQPPGGGGPTPPQRCTRYQVTIVSIDVSNIDDGFLGGTLEVRFSFVVNGQVRTWVNNSLDVGISSIGLTFFVDVPSDTSTITLAVSGVEIDPFFDDPLPGFTHVWGQAQNWGLGAQSGGGSDSNIIYTLNYQITCARQIDVTIPRNVLLEYGKRKAEQRRGVEGREESILLSWAIDRVRREGWQIISSTDQEYVFKGAGAFPGRIIKKLRGGEEREGGRAGKK
jgi:hypothetical protein